jgi:circadian clock protein KaiC
MAHSNQIREFLITDRGVELRDVYVGPGGVLTGSARIAQEAQERVAEMAARQQSDRRRFELDRKRKALERRIALMRAEFEAEMQEVEATIAQDETREQQRLIERAEIAGSRGFNGAGRQTRAGAEK